MEIFRCTPGESAIILSMPHSGIALPPHLESRMTPQARKLPDTDWHIPRLYDFSTNLGITVLQANYSRYVVDLNRPRDDADLYPGQSGTGLCPETLFDGNPVYYPGEEPDDRETDRRLRQYWNPYHYALKSEINRLKSKHGFAILYDCHSIRSRISRLFDGELPAFNLGTASGDSCAPDLQRGIEKAMQASGLSHVSNGRFTGGHITRHYGNPSSNIHAVQMELAQNAYMIEDDHNTYDRSKAQRLRAVLVEILQIALHWTPGQTSLF